MKEINLKGKVLMVIAFVIATVMIATALICNKAVFNNGNAEPLEMQATNFSLNSNELISASTKLLGSPYAWDTKGIKSNKFIYSPGITSKDLKTISEVCSTGVDCSGLVYYALTSLGYSTKGFAEQNPVPYNTYHWYNNFLTNTNSTLQIGKNNDWKNVNVLKRGETITESIRYYKDEKGRNLPAGTIIISQNTSNYKYDHMWIYLGDLGTSDVNQVKKILVSMGANESDLNRTINGKPVVEALGGNCTHWRIESAGSVGVRINNIDPNNGVNDNGKTIGKIWAFQIANEVNRKGEYNLRIVKKDYNGSSLKLSKDIFSTEISKSGAKAVKMNGSLNNDGTVKYNTVKMEQKDIGTKDIIKIKEETPPAGYEKYDKTIELTVSKNKDSKSNTNIEIGVSNVRILDKDGKVIDQAAPADKTHGNTYDNGMVKVDYLNNGITVTINNKKFDLALKKSITKVTHKNGDKEETKEVSLANGFNVSRNFKESLYIDNVTEHGNIGVDVTKLVNGSDTNAVYWMNKTPVEVSVGDKVEYSIKIFNEGQVTAKARDIRDYIPKGLKVSKVVYNSNELTRGKYGDVHESFDKGALNGYTYDEEKGVLIILLHDDNDFIDAFDKTKKKLSYKEVLVTCEVEKDAQGVLTNVAEITKYQTVGQTTFSNTDTDIDSTSKSWKAPSEDKGSDEWRAYSTGEKGHASDEAWHPDFLAQDEGVNGNKGDDDDFDKLVVKGSYRLTLKKVNEANSQGISDIKFNIERKNGITGTTEKFENVALQDAQVGYTEELSNSANGNITYTFKEQEDSKYVQLTKDLKLELNVTNGKFDKYSLYYGDSTYGDVTDTEKTYKFSNNGIELSVKVTVDFDKSDIKVEIGNKVNEASDYGIRLKKISSGDGKALKDVTFKVKSKIGNSSEEEKELNTKNDDGYTSVLSNKIDLSNVDISDVYTISEIKTADGFTKFNKQITVTVEKYTNSEQKFGVKQYKVECNGKTMILNSDTSDGSFTIEESGVNYRISAKLEKLTADESKENNENKQINGITITIPNAPDKPINLKIKKVSKKENGEEEEKTLKGVELKVVKEETNAVLSPTVETSGEISYTDKVSANTNKINYVITELKAPEGYENTFAGKQIKLEVPMQNGEPSKLTAKVYDKDGKEDSKLSEDVYAEINESNSTKEIELVIKNPKIIKPIDLALKKVIVEIDGKSVKEGNGIDKKYDRLTDGEDKYRIDTKPLKDGKNDAEYHLNKTPILVQKGSTVKYQIRIYNEGSDVDATASEIKDYLPEGLEFKNLYYQDETDPLTKDTDYSYENNTLTIKVLAQKNLIKKFNKEDSDTSNSLSSDYVTVECQVKDTAKGILTNVAEITAYKTNESDNVTKDRDSEPNNWENPVGGENDKADRKNQKWIDYAGKESNNIEEGKFQNYLGQQDDDDFEKIIVGDIDLVLKKIITKIGDKDVNTLDEVYRRFENEKEKDKDNGEKDKGEEDEKSTENKVKSDDEEGKEKDIRINTEEFNKDDKVTTAEYYMNKNPIKVKKDDKVTYQIRIYNEGSIDATASEIKDYIPKGLTLEQVQCDGKDLTKEEHYTIDKENVLTIKALAGTDKLISKYNGEKPEYKYVTVVCKVNGSVLGLLTNVAEISKYQTVWGETDKDRDSQTVDKGAWPSPKGSDKNTLEGKSGADWARYYDNSSRPEFKNYIGHQDDDDFEKIIVTSGYTLKLRKLSSATNEGLEGVKFKIGKDKPDLECTTDSDGNINGLDFCEFKYENTGSTAITGKLDEYRIKEESTKENYSKIGLRTNRNVPDGYDLKDEFYFYVAHKREDDGSDRLLGYYLNFKESRPEGGNVLYNNLANKSATYYLTDQDNNLMELNINVSEDQENIGNYIIDMQLDNNIKNSQYNLNIKKVDEEGKTIDGATFAIETDNKYMPFPKTAETVKGLIYYGPMTISKDNVNQKDTFTIEEINTPSKYYKLREKLQLVVTKGLTDNGYKVTSMKLLSNGKESDEGKEITLEGVELEKNKGTVDITAKLDGNGITLTITNKRKKFDLALRKFIVAVGNDSINRWSTPNVDVSNLVDNTATTAKYNNAKDVVNVHIKDVVLYGIRVYNEGDLNGYAQLVMDDVPEGLEMLVPGDGTNNTSIVNADFRWQMYRKLNGNESVGSANVIEYQGAKYVKTTNPAEADVIVTDYLSKEYGETLIGEDPEQVNPNLLYGFDAETMNEPDSNEIMVEFKVKETNASGVVIENKAQITDDSDEDGKDVEDRDSTPNEWENPPRDDDQDVEKIVVHRDFDLALRKFITKVNDKELENSREPIVDTEKLASGESTTAEYRHSKDPVLVNPRDVVEYTIRIYNEGEMDGYADYIMDDIPEGLEMIAPDYTPDGTAANLNAEYKWVMYKEVAGNDANKDIINDAIIYAGKTYQPTSKISEAKLIVTDYLKGSLIKAFNPEETTELDYKDVKVQFKVKKVEADKLITNYAQITDDKDSDKKDVEDRDSTPNVWENPPRDDDQDYDVVKVGYFDLALYKWVSTAIVTENGKTTEYASNHSEFDKSNLVNVSIPKNKLNKVRVKFKYQIKVENQGSIAGKAMEVKDHIPAGLKFVAEDNTEFGWVENEDGTVSTDYLKDTVLQPQETAEVTIVLTWINGSNNMGQKVNNAEISEDYNDYGWPDIDSTPDNFKDEPKEDDEDGDLVLLQIRTGIVSNSYIVVGIVALSIIAVGVYGIKKFV